MSMDEFCGVLLMVIVSVSFMFYLVCECHTTMMMIVATTSRIHNDRTFINIISRDDVLSIKKREYDYIVLWSVKCIVTTRFYLLLQRLCMVRKQEDV